MKLLEVNDLKVNYAGIKALKGISFSVEQGQIVTLIGANGAGKSTALRAIMGLLPMESGKVFYSGKEITGLDTQKIVSQGLCMVPEGRRVFTSLSVFENLRIGAYMRKDSAGIQESLNHVYELFPRLKERAWQMAGTLSGGEQQMLAVGRALMAKPKLLLMDEPSLGLAPLIVKDIFAIIKRLSEEGITILLIEQNANAALRAAHYGYVLETGLITLEGSGESLLGNQQVRDAYLGHAKSKKSPVA